MQIELPIKECWIFLWFFIRFWPLQALYWYIGTIQKLLTAKFWSPALLVMEFLWFFEEGGQNHIFQKVLDPSSSMLFLHSSLWSELQLKSMDQKLQIEKWGYRKTFKYFHIYKQKRHKTSNKIFIRPISSKLTF